VRGVVYGGLMGIAAWLGIAAVAVAVANAYSIHRYTVRDAGPEIVHKLTVCDWQIRPGFEVKFGFVAYTEHESGDDGGSVRYTDWLSRGCTRETLTHDDDLEYEGRYFGRVRVRSGAVRFTSWRPFWSS
jgi:hypothetical protein